MMVGLNILVDYVTVTLNVYTHTNFNGENFGFSPLTHKIKRIYKKLREK